MAQEPPPAANAYLTIAGIPGESVAAPGAIDIQYHFFNAASQAGRALFGDFSFGATVSKASPFLMLGVGTGARYSTAVLSVRRTDGLQAEFTKFRLRDVLITSYRPSNQSDTGLPTEQFSLAYTQICDQGARPRVFTDNRTFPVFANGGVVDPTAAPRFPFTHEQVLEFLAIGSDSVGLSVRLTEGR